MVYGGNGDRGTVHGGGNGGIGAEEPRDKINNEKNKSGVTDFGREGNGKENTAIAVYLIVTAARADGAEGCVAVCVSGVGMSVMVTLEEMDSSLKVPFDKTGVGRGVTVGISGGIRVLLGLAGRVQGARECSKNLTVEIASMNAWTQVHPGRCRIGECSGRYK